MPNDPSSPKLGELELDLDGPARPRAQSSANLPAVQAPGGALEEDDEMPLAAFELGGPAIPAAKASAPESMRQPEPMTIADAPPVSSRSPAPGAMPSNPATEVLPSNHAAPSTPFVPPPAPKRPREVPPAMLDAYDRVMDFLPRAWWVRALALIGIAIVLGNGFARGFGANSTIILMVIVVLSGVGVYAGLKYSE